MNNIIIENIVRYIVLYLLQILLINNLQLLGLCSPAIYILCLIALPVSLPRWVELLIGFGTGFIIDIFSNTLGIHAAACTLVSFLRPILIQNFISDKERLIGTLNSNLIGWNIYIKLVIILVFSHHTLLFFLEAFSFHNWWLTLSQIIISSIFTLVCIFGYELIRR